METLRSHGRYFLGFKVICTKGEISLALCNAIILMFYPLPWVGFLDPLLMAYDLSFVSE